LFQIFLSHNFTERHWLCKDCYTWFSVV